MIYFCTISNYLKPESGRFLLFILISCVALSFVRLFSAKAGKKRALKFFCCCMCAKTRKKNQKRKKKCKKRHTEWQNKNTENVIRDVRKGTQSKAKQKKNDHKRKEIKYKNIECQQFMPWIINRAGKHDIRFCLCYQNWSNERKKGKNCKKLNQMFNSSQTK